MTSLFEKNIYIKQAEVKGSIKQNNTGTFLLNELTVNASLKRYKEVLHSAMEITIAELNYFNHQMKLEKEKEKEKTKEQEKTRAKAKKTEARM